MSPEIAGREGEGDIAEPRLAGGLSIALARHSTGSVVGDGGEGLATEICCGHCDDAPTRTAGGPLMGAEGL
jgi:hypothetical protein